MKNNNNKLNCKYIILFFCGDRNLNIKPYIYYALFLPTELSSQGQYIIVIFKYTHTILIEEKE